LPCLIEQVVELWNIGLSIIPEQIRTEHNYLFRLSMHSLSQLQSYKMKGFSNIHIQF